MRAYSGLIGLLAAGALAATASIAHGAEMKVYTDPEHADTDFKFQGEYADASAKLGAQVPGQEHGRGGRPRVAAVAVDENPIRPGQVDPQQGLHEGGIRGGRPGLFPVVQIRSDLGLHKAPRSILHLRNIFLTQIHV